MLLLPLKLILVDPSTPTELLLGTDGVDEGVPVSVTFPLGVCIPLALEFRRDPDPPCIEEPF